MLLKSGLTALAFSAGGGLLGLLSYLSAIEYGLGSGMMFAETDPISGGAGWVGAGLLGSVLAWLLLVHLPAKDKRDREKDEIIARMVTAKDKSIRDTQEDFREALNALALDFRSELKLEREACDKNQRLRDEVSERNFKVLAEAIRNEKARGDHEQER